MAEPRSIEQFVAEIDREVAALPPGSDVAGYITRRHRELGEMLAQRVAKGRETASKEAAFPPPACPRCGRRAMRPMATPRPRTILLREGGSAHCPDGS